MLEHDHCSSHSYVSIYPRKGTVTAQRLVPNKQLQVSIYPRKGTVTHPAGSGYLFHYCFNLSPQGDGNHSSHVPSQLASCFNLSPQGDGNLVGDESDGSFCSFNLSPQGDGNPSSLTTLFSTSTAVSIYPRKGTVTGTRPGSWCSQSTFQFIPARGQKNPHLKKDEDFFVSSLTASHRWAYEK